jgi:methylthioribose-1-phosphate isomerase
VIEERAKEEMTRVKGLKVQGDGQIAVDQAPEVVSIAAVGMDVWNPAFDITPAALIDGVVTDLGVVESVDGIYDFASLFQSAIQQTMGTDDG